MSEYEYRVLTPAELEWNQELTRSLGHTPPAGFRECARRPAGTGRWFVHHLTEAEYAERFGSEAGRE